jgi:hypothetical protein
MDDAATGFPDLNRAHLRSVVRVRFGVPAQDPTLRGCSFELTTGALSRGAVHQLAGDASGLRVPSVPARGSSRNRLVPR